MGIRDWIARPVFFVLVHAPRRLAPYSAPLADRVADWAGWRWTLDDCPPLAPIEGLIVTDCQGSADFGPFEFPAFVYVPGTPLAEVEAEMRARYAAMQHRAGGRS